MRQGKKKANDFTQMKHERDKDKKKRVKRKKKDSCIIYEKFDYEEG